jgi:hypothetical protein
MSTLNEIVAAIQESLQDDAYPSEVLIPKINLSLLGIAAGIRLPTGEISPPLPDLFTYGTVNTSITLPYVSLPTNYQRQLITVYDSLNVKINPPRGGDYRSFTKFLRQINTMDMTESGEIYVVCVKGTKIYYQGIPTASTTLGLHYYKKPATMSLDGDVPEELPDHLQLDLLKHHVCMKIFADIESGQYNKGIGVTQHATQFYSALTQLIDFIGVDSEPAYYGSDESEDAGACDG